MNDVISFIAYLLDAVGKAELVGLVVVGVGSLLYGFFVVGRKKK